jgi:hypothetical protein
MVLKLTMTGGVGSTLGHGSGRGANFRLPAPGRRTISSQGSARRGGLVEIRSRGCQKRVERRQAPKPALARVEVADHLAHISSWRKTKVWIPSTADGRPNSPACASAAR